MGITVENCNINLTLFRGPQGATGIQGKENTIRGTTGSTGFNGSNGIKGATGAQGFIGGIMTGLRGLQGTLGVQGGIGSVGRNGEDPTGPQGPQGGLGNPGLDIPGLTGPQGPQGEEGIIGETGESTIIGLQGELGPVGPDGPTGTPSPISSGLIFRQNSIVGRFETIPILNWTLIQSKLSGKHNCGVGNIEAWNRTANIYNISTDTSQISGHPATFVINIPGTYYISYNISFSLFNSDLSDDNIGKVIDFECQAGVQEPRQSIPGSICSATVGNNQIHISHNFLHNALNGDRIGLYASNEEFDTRNLCINLFNSNFLVRLLTSN